jgi:hypothetical protein
MRRLTLVIEQENTPNPGVMVRFKIGRSGLERIQRRYRLRLDELLFASTKSEAVAKRDKDITDV